jgi:hypothetical protein
MEHNEYLRRNRLFRRLRSGPHGQLVERYAARLVEDGLARHGTWRCFNVVGGLLSWIASRRRALVDLDERSVEQCLRHRAEKQSILLGDLSALKRWLSVLREEGAIAPAVLPPSHLTRSDLQRVRCLSADRARLGPEVHLPVIRRFLHEGVPRR